MRQIIKLIRVYQWTKSGFVILPFVFSPRLNVLLSGPFSPEAMDVYIRMAIAFFAFSFTASSVYVLNDWKDRELDRQDPRKKKRPLASGAISATTGLFLMIGLFLSGVSMAFYLSPSVLLIILIYFALNVFYNFGGKRIILIDVFIIASGYILRVLVGATVIQIVASPWLLSTTFFLALFLGFFKRYYECLESPPEDYIGGRYNTETLKHFTSITAALAILTYAIYTIEGTNATANLFWTIPLVVLGIFRYYVLLQSTEELDDGNPSDLLLSDRFLLLVIFVWLSLSAYLLINDEKTPGVHHEPGISIIRE